MKPKPLPDVNSRNAEDIIILVEDIVILPQKITIIGTNNVKTRNQKLTFKNNAQFRSCTSKINNTLTHSAKDLDTVMLMYNLLEYSENYS